MRLIMILALIFAIPAVCFAQTTYYVDDDAPNDPGPGDPGISDPLEDGSFDHPFDMIQEAIDVAVNGDLVLVLPGTYYENIDFIGKEITVRSTQGPALTIIDGSKPSDPNYGSTVTFQSGEGSGAVLKGFTIKNGTGTRVDIGVGYDRWYGGGVYICNDSSPIIVDNIIMENACGDGSLTGCGGGIGTYKASSPLISRNIIKENLAFGGTDHSTYGGGIFVKESGSLQDPVEIWNNLIIYNKCEENNVGECGGGICNSQSYTTIGNCTIYGNVADYEGGGIDVSYQEKVTIINTILWDNSSAIGSEIKIGDGNGYPAEVTISYSDTMGGKSNVHVYNGATLNWGSGMIDADPLFVDPANHDFHLTYPSPCRNTGDNSAVTELYDFEGDPRIAWSGTVDMGADEFYTHLYITGDQTPGGDIQGKFVGLPGTSPVYLIISSDAWETPVSTPYGDLYLMPPRAWFPLVPIPTNGILILNGTIPPLPPAPYDIPMQGLVGLNPDSLTNLCVLEVR